MKKMKKAKYSTLPDNHFGLGFSNYTHFTSPIRRYADLLVHQIIKDNIKDSNSLYGLIELCNEGELKSQLCEREYQTLKGLRLLNHADWRRYYRDSENTDDANSSHGEPKFVIKSPDNRKFGLSPIPDKVYNVHFYAFNRPTALSAHSDEIVFPEQYSNVITARVRYYVWQFKESPQQAAFALDDYKKGLKYMKSNLMNPTPRRMTDDRTYF